MRTKLCVVGAGLGLLAALAATPVVAHHAFGAEFDAQDAELDDADDDDDSEIE